MPGWSDNLLPALLAGIAGVVFLIEGVRTLLHREQSDE